MEKTTFTTEPTVTYHDNTNETVLGGMFLGAMLTLLIVSVFKD